MVNYMKQIQQDIKQNLAWIKEVFENNATVNYREIQDERQQLYAALVCLDGLVSTQIIHDSILPPLQKWGRTATMDQLKTHLLQALEQTAVTTYEEAIYAVLAGDTILLLDGSSEILVIDTKGFSSRSITEPEGEQVLRGPKEGFTEVLMNNLTLIRRRLQNPNLKMEITFLRTSARTLICICYIKGIAKPSLVELVQSKLHGLLIEECYDVNAIQERIKDSPLSFFKTMGLSERVDNVVSKLCEGRVAIVVDGSPGVLTAPYVFMENFHAPDDYYLNFYYASLSRILRFIGFLVAILLPACYLAVITFHKEMLPFSLLLSVIKARSGIPFPSIVEAVILILCLELVQEATIRGPKQLAAPLGLVAAIVFGDAAINAKLISATMLIVIAFSALSAIMNPRFRSSILMLRFSFLFAAVFLGFFGIFFLALLVLAHLFALTSFQVPYMSSIPSLKGLDNLLRVPAFIYQRKPHASK